LCFSWNCVWAILRVLYGIKRGIFVEKSNVSFQGFGLEK